MEANRLAWLDHLVDEVPLPLELPADPSTIVVLTDRAGIVAATLRFVGRGGEYTGARGGDMHLRARLVELFHHRKRAAVKTSDTPFGREWLRTHFQIHLHAIEPALVAHPPVFGDHPDLAALAIGKPLPLGLRRRYCLTLPGEAGGFAPA